MPDFLMDLFPVYESGGKPPGSMCYQSELDNQFLDVSRMADLVSDMKDMQADRDPTPGIRSSRVAIGLIGGAQNQGPNQRRQGSATDCRASAVTSDEQPATDCSGLTGVDSAFADAWCDFTEDTSGAGVTCDALAGNRYVDFASAFRRKTFDSICRTGNEAFGDALEDFALIATLACFELNDVRPHADDAELITVKRLPRELVDLEEEPFVMPQVEPNEPNVPEGGGWYYDSAENKICLVGIDRLLGDIYDIFILKKNVLDYSR